MSYLLAQSQLPPPASIREAAREVISRPYYKLDSSTSEDATPLLLQLIRWILKPFQWLFDQMEGLPDAVRWIVVIFCVVLCVALIGHILYTLIKAVGNPVARRRISLADPTREIGPDEFEQQAALAETNRDYIAAVRLLFRAALRRLEIFEKKKFRPGITNRELVRRYRSTPLADSLVQFVNPIDLKWYGQLPCEQTDFIACRNEHGRICEYIRESKPADRA
jgi:hypothetical protein